jgi:acyl-[acyl-carrier-protein] desaturase
MTTMNAAPTTSDVGLNERLTEVAEASFAQHIANAKPWFPIRPAALGPVVRAKKTASTDESALESALVVNLLTEDNLPAYHLALWRMFGDRGVWGEWLHQWTAEEGRHAIALRSYATESGLVDVFLLERLRMVQVRNGFDTSFLHGVPDALVYLTMQELATRAAHRNTGAVVGDPTGAALMTRISMDENLHYVFYRDLGSAALEFAPSQMMEAIAGVVASFAMPGATIPGFRDRARRIAEAGIYNLDVHAREVLTPLLLHRWKILDVRGLSPAAERARDTLVAFLGRVEAAAARQLRGRKPRAFAAGSY